MSSYTVVRGDTYSIIARKVYGDESQAGRIAKANPGAEDNLQPGSVLTVPPAPAQQPAQAPATDDPNAVELRINGNAFTEWTSVRIGLNMDAITTVAFESPYDVDDQTIREAFRPFSFADIEVLVGGSPVFSGVIVHPAPRTAPSSRTVALSCYSRAGLLTDCTAPASAFPLEWNDLTLQTVANELCDVFGVAVEFPDGAGPVFERISLEPGDRVLPFLSRLAAQRNLVITSTAQGGLRFYRPTSQGNTVAELEEGRSPLVDAGSSYKPQQYYSHVTGITPVLVGLPGAQYTVKNPHLTGITRPFTFEVKDMPDAELRAAVEAKAGRMFANAAEYTLSVDTWRDQNGDLWQPGALVSLLAPGADVFQRSNLQIRSVELSRTSSQEMADIVLMIPGALAGETPGALPWAG